MSLGFRIEAPLSEKVRLDSTSIVKSTLVSNRLLPLDGAD